MTHKDYYKTLGLERSASADQIKSAYKKLAVKYHPDVNKESGAEAKFKEINEAYQVLSDQKKRQTYDQFGTADFSGANGGFNQGQGFGGFDFSGFTNGDASGFGDIFETFFGGGRGRQQRRGNDIELIVQLSFEEAVFGVTKELHYSVLDACGTCKGKGGENLKRCETCSGSGRVTRATRTMLGSFAQTVVCPECHGKGQSPSITCRECGGAALTRQEKKVRVAIPAGVNDDASIRIAGSGEGGLDGNGDLYLRLKVSPHKDFERDGYDIVSDATISFASAVLGDTVSIDTLYGPVRLTIPAGTASHTRFVLKNKGVVHPNSKRYGAHYVTIQVEVPKKLTRDERALIEKLKGLR